MQANREITFYSNSLNELILQLKSLQRGITTDSTGGGGSNPYEAGYLVYKDSDGKTNINAVQKTYNGVSWTKRNNEFGNIDVDIVNTTGLDDDYLVTPVTIAESGITALDPAFTATSLVGCLNELKNDIIQPNQLWDTVTDTLRPKASYDYVDVKSGLKDIYATGIPVGEMGHPSLSGFSASSLIGALNELKSDVTGVIGGTGAFAAPYKFNSSTSIADPTSGKVAVNNATPSAGNPYTISVSETDDDGNDRTYALLGMRAGDIIQFNDSNSTKYYAFTIVNKPVDQGGGWWTIEVTGFSFSGGVFTNNEALIINGILIREPVKTLNGFNWQDTGTSISFVNGTRTFTITPTATSFTFYSNDIEYTKNGSLNLVITNTEGRHYVYFDDDGNLAETTSFDNNLIDRWAFIAEIYWDATNQEAVTVVDERHSFDMGPSTHRYLHATRGSVYQLDGGLALTDFAVDGSGDTEAEIQFGLTNGAVWDEELQHNMIDGSPQEMNPLLTAPIVYRTGASGDWRKIAATTYPISTTGTGRVAYNEWTGATWQLTEVPNGDYAVYHVMGIGDIYTPVFIIMGQDTYTTINDAQNGAITEASQIQFGSLPAAEIKLLYSFIVQTNNSYTNSKKARFRSLDDGGVAVDWRISSLGLTANALDSLWQISDINGSDYLEPNVSVKDIRVDSVLVGESQTAQYRTQYTPFGVEATPHSTKWDNIFFGGNTFILAPSERITVKYDGSSIQSFHNIYWDNTNGYQSFAAGPASWITENASIWRFQSWTPTGADEILNLGSPVSQYVLDGQNNVINWTGDIDIAGVYKLNGTPLRFLDLNDTPASYTPSALFAVNGAGNAISLVNFYYDGSSPASIYGQTTQGGRNDRAEFAEYGFKVRDITDVGRKVEIGKDEIYLQNNGTTGDFIHLLAQDEEIKIQKGSGAYNGVFKSGVLTLSKDVFTTNDTLEISVDTGIDIPFGSYRVNGVPLVSGIFTPSAGGAYYNGAFLRLGDATGSGEDITLQKSGMQYNAVDGTGNSVVMSPSGLTIANTTYGSIFSLNEDGLSIGGFTIPETQNTSYVNQRIGYGGTITGSTATSLSMWLTSNAYFNSSGVATFLNNGAACMQIMDQGAINWSTVASGTAGNPAALATRMRLDVSGNLGLATTLPKSNFQIGDALCFTRQNSGATEIDSIARNAYVSGATWKRTVADNDCSLMVFDNSGSIVLYGNTDALSAVDSDISWQQNARFTKGGSLLLGTTTTGTKKLEITAAYGEHIKLIRDVDANQGGEITAAAGVFDFIANGNGSHPGYRFYTNNGTISVLRMLLDGNGNLYTNELTSLATPSSGFGNWGCKTDGKPYFKNDAGTEFSLSVGSVCSYQFGRYFNASLYDGVSIPAAGAYDEDATADPVVKVRTTCAGTVTSVSIQCNTWSTTSALLEIRINGTEYTVGTVTSSSQTFTSFTDTIPSISNGDNIDFIFRSVTGGSTLKGCSIVLKTS